MSDRQRALPTSVPRSRKYNPQLLTSKHLNNLGDGYNKAEKAKLKEQREECNSPTDWVHGQKTPTPAKKKPGHIVMGFMKGWPLRGAPDQPGLITPERLSDGVVLWEPERARLTDEAVIFALLMLPPTKRTELFTYDFDTRGEIRPKRTLCGQTVVTAQNNIRTLLVWRDYYVFTSRTNQYGWLLRKAPITNLARKKGWLRAGLVLAPIQIDSLSAPGGLDMTLRTLFTEKPTNHNAIDLKVK